MIFEQPNPTDMVDVQYSQLRDAVVSEAIIDQKLVGRGVCDASFVQFEGGLTAIFKPYDWGYDGNYGEGEGWTTHNEIFWSELDRDILGWNIVPASVFGVLDDFGSGEVLEGSYHYRINGETLPDYDRAKGWSGRSRIQQAVLDIVLGAVDRHEGNMIWDGNKTWAIDNGRCMGVWLEEEEYIKGALQIEDDYDEEDAEDYKDMVTYACDALHDVIDKWDDITRLMHDYGHGQFVPEAQDAVFVLQKILLALWEIESIAPEPSGLVTVMIGKYRFTKSPEEIIRWIHAGWDDHTDCKCYKCLLIKEYRKKGLIT